MLEFLLSFKSPLDAHLPRLPIFPTKYFSLGVPDDTCAAPCPEIFDIFLTDFLRDLVENSLKNLANILQQTEYTTTF